VKLDLLLQLLERFRAQERAEAISECGEETHRLAQLPDITPSIAASTRSNPDTFSPSLRRPDAVMV
jgi:hypothetical protein